MHPYTPTDTHIKDFVDVAQVSVCCISLNQLAELFRLLAYQGHNVRVVLEIKSDLQARTRMFD